jgi:hypothetical protein
MHDTLVAQAAEWSMAMRTAGVSGDINMEHGEREIAAGLSLVAAVVSQTSHPSMVDDAKEGHVQP